MTKNYKHIILTLWFGLLWASPAMASFENKPAANYEVFSTAKDSLNSKEKDTTKVKKVSEAHLNHLQQLSKYKGSVFNSKTNKETSASIINVDLVEKENAASLPSEKVFRSFPSLDQKLVENQNFNISFANREPEFNEAFLAENFQQNPAVEKLIKNAKGALSAVAKLGNFVDIITGKELLELPVGLKKTDQTSNNSVELAITEVKFTPGYALLKVWARLVVPEKGETKDGKEKDRGVDRELFFGAEIGRYNVLNVPDELYISSQQFWEEFNMPFLDEAIKRGDEITLATKPTPDVLNKFDKFGNVDGRSGFGREYDHLVANGYKYDEASGLMKKVGQSFSSLSILKANTTFKTYCDNLTSTPSLRKYAKILSIEEEAILKFYTTSLGYKELNRALRGEVPLTKFYTAQKNLMEQALSKIPNSKYNNPNNLLYRIENLTENQINSTYVEGRLIHKSSFTSATYAENAIIDAIRVRSYNVLIRIEGKNGKLIEDISTLPNEKEILFTTNTEFEVTKVGFSPNPDDYMTPLKTIWLKEK